MFISPASILLTVRALQDVRGNILGTVGPEKSLGASTATTVIGAGMVGGVSGDIAIQGFEGFIGDRDAFSIEQMAMSGLLGGGINYGANRLLSPRITTGKIGNSEMGRLGEQRAAAELLEEYGPIRGQQVKVGTPDGSPTVDYFVDDVMSPSGLRRIEIKTGNAKLSYAQEYGYVHIRAGNGVPFGKAAEKAGLVTGQTLAEAPVDVWRHLTYEFLPLQPGIGAGLGTGPSTIGMWYDQHNSEMSGIRQDPTGKHIKP